MAFKRL